MTHEPYEPNISDWLLVALAFLVAGGILWGVWTKMVALS